MTRSAIQAAPSSRATLLNRLCAIVGAAWIADRVMAGFSLKLRRTAARTLLLAQQGNAEIPVRNPAILCASV